MRREKESKKKRKRRKGRNKKETKVCREPEISGENQNSRKSKVCLFVCLKDKLCEFDFIATTEDGCK